MQDIPAFLITNLTLSGLNKGGTLQDGLNTNGLIQCKLKINDIGVHVAIYAHKLGKFDGTHLCKLAMHFLLLISLGLYSFFPSPL